MHRWFRICALAALLSASQNVFAEEPPLDSALPADVGSAGPAISKHNLRATQTQILQHLQDETVAIQHQLDEQSGKAEDQRKLAEHQSKQLEAQSKQLEDQGKLAGELSTRLQEQTKQIGALQTQLAHASELLEQLALSHSGHPSPAASPSPAANMVGEPESAPPRALPAAPEAPIDPDGNAYVISKGDNLISIAHHHGTTVSEILKLNKISDERKLRIGQTLILPKTGASQSPSSSPQP